jgi:uncharacterized protein YciI
MSEYTYLIHPFRDGFFENPSPEEKTILEEHLAYIQKAAEAGIVLLAGSCMDDTFGLVIFHAENDESANAFMFADPGVQKNIMAAELHPIHISIRGK